jgi:uncharacterized protein (TIGR00251 family)
MLPVEQRGDDVLVSVRAQPKASRVSVFVQAGGVKVAVTAPPAEGLANRMVCEAIADKVGVPKSRVSMYRGDKSRDKVLILSGCRAEEVRARLGF